MRLLRGGHAFSVVSSPVMALSLAQTLPCRSGQRGRATEASLCDLGIAVDVQPASVMGIIGSQATDHKIFMLLSGKTN